MVHKQDNKINNKIREISGNLLFEKKTVIRKSIK